MNFIGWVLWLTTLFLPVVSSEPEPQPVLLTSTPTPIEQVQPLIWVDIWPVELQQEARAIVQCESRGVATAQGDSGNSLGLFQLWVGWFTPTELAQWSNSVVNSQVALRVRLLRGRWGGRGGWSCADLLGIY